MTRICNIRWAYYNHWSSTEIEDAMKVVEVSGKDLSAESFFATMVRSNGMEEVFLSPVSLFDLLGCDECCYEHFNADRHKMESLAYNRILCAAGTLYEELADKPCGWGLMAAADCAMGKYLTALEDNPETADEVMEQYRNSCRCKKVYECISTFLYDVPECADCYGCCGECIDDPELDYARDNEPDAEETDPDEIMEL